MRRRRRKYVSAVETRLLNFLREHFVDVRAQVRAHGQRIDMYIKDIDMFVQLDGVYWHGLDESLDRPNLVLRKMRKDMLLNGMFIGAKSGSKLFRISDLQWIHLEETGKENDILDAISHAKPGLTEFQGYPGFRLQKK